MKLSRRVRLKGKFLKCSKYKLPIYFYLISLLK